MTEILQVSIMDHQRINKLPNCSVVSVIVMLLFEGTGAWHLETAVSH